ncbi:MAG: hypothetical protein QG646_4090 [Euryarchaeota archaeon]|nr:hypothetical protein [Euryarchaeota archaeon]
MWGDPSFFGNCRAYVIVNYLQTQFSIKQILEKSLPDKKSFRGFVIEGILGNNYNCWRRVHFPYYTFPLQQI